jgi:hypothetical protein
MAGRLVGYRLPPGTGRPAIGVLTVEYVRLGVPFERSKGVILSAICNDGRRRYMDFINNQIMIM